MDRLVDMTNKEVRLMIKATERNVHGNGYLHPTVANLIESMYESSFNNLDEEQARLKVNMLMPTFLEDTRVMLEAFSTGKRIQNAVYQIPSHARKLLTRLEYVQRDPVWRNLTVEELGRVVRREMTYSQAFQISVEREAEANQAPGEENPAHQAIKTRNLTDTGQGQSGEIISYSSGQEGSGKKI